MISFALITRDCEDTLPTCLRSIKPLADEIIVVDTGSTDGTIAVAQAFGARIGHYSREIHPDDFLAIPDERGGLQISLANFAAARNLSFEMARYPWIFWLDADDELTGTAHWWEMLARFEASGADGVVLPYEYAFDSRGKCVTLLWRERLVRKQSTWRWEGVVHETLPPVGRHLATFDKVRVIHHKAKRVRPVLRRRNLEILKAKAPPDDPRTLFYLGTEHTFLGEYKEALAAFQRYLTISVDEEETYQALFYLGDLHRVLGQWEVAIQHYQKAILIRPGWRVAYFGLAAAFGHIQDWDRCLYYLAQGKSQPEQSGTLLAHNPKHESIGWAEWAVNAYRGKGDIGKALEACREGLAEDPDNPTLKKAADELAAQWNEAQGARAVAEAAEFLVRRDAGADAAKLLQLAGGLKAPIADLLRATHRNAEKNLAPGRTFQFQRIGQSAMDPRLAWLCERLAESPRAYRIAFPAAGDNLAPRVLAGDFAYEVIAWEPNREVAEAVGQIVEWEFGKRRFRPACRPLLDGPPEPVDIVVLSGVLEHSADPGKAIEAARSWLRPGGRLLVIVPNGSVPYARAEPSPSNIRLHRFVPNDLRRLCRTDRIPTLISETNGPGWLALATDPEKPSLVHPRTIGIACAPALEAWGPFSLTTGIGGSEEAIIRLSRALVARGHRVLVYGEWVGLDETPAGLVEYRRLGDAERRHDLLVAWRAPELLGGRRLPDAEWLWLWLHDTIEEARVLSVAEHLDAVLVGSHFHASLYPKLAGLLRVQRYGIDRGEFARTNGGIARLPAKFVWTSCPTRGLETLLDSWPGIRAGARDAELHVFYDFVNFDIMRQRATGVEAEQLAALRQRIRQKANQPGVHWRGRVPQQQIAEEMLSAGVFAYPTNFPEIMCISGAKAQAAGCWPVFYPLAALPETLAWGWPSSKESFVADCVAAASGERPEAERSAMRRWAQEVYSWEQVALGWERLLTGA